MAEWLAYVVGTLGTLWALSSLVRCRGEPGPWGWGGIAFVSGMVGALLALLGGGR